MMRLRTSPSGPPRTGERSFLIGLIGKNIQRSRSPAMHEREADALGLRCLYQLIDLDVLGRGVESLETLVASAELMGFCGLNVTHPCKQAVVPLLGELSEEARAIGAVNTVRLVDGRRIGYNTDASGFADSFRRGLGDVAIDRVAQVGAGGAGAATAYAMLSLGAGHVAVFDADPGRAAELVRNLRGSFAAARLSVAPDLKAAIDAADGIVHATPTGMREHPGLPFPVEYLRPALWVADIVYFPLRTELLREAQARGCRVLDGGGMAVFQAAAAFELFTGRTADRERMLQGFRNTRDD